MRIINPVHDPGWDLVIALHRDASCFHTSAWAKVLHHTYNHQPFYLQFSRGRRLAALIPLMEVRSPLTGRRGVCLPFSDVCEPLIFDPEAAHLVRDRVVRFAQERRWKHLEIRGKKSFQSASSSAAKFYGHTLDLRCGVEDMASSFDSQVRRAIRKAERSNVSAVIAHNRQAIDDFYRLHVQTRRRHGLPPQPASFFKTVYDDSNFLGTHRKKQLITSESIHRVGSVSLQSAVRAACTSGSLADYRWCLIDSRGRSSIHISTKG